MDNLPMVITLPLAYQEQAISGLLFDLDGTLLDTARDLGAAVNALLLRDGLALISDDVIYHTASQGALALIKAGYGEGLTDAQYQRLRQEFLDHYEQHIASHTDYFPGVEALLTRLNQQHIPWGIVTNKPYVYTKLLLAYFPLLRDCAVTVCGDTLAQRKPQPHPLILAAKSLAIAPTQLAYVGDARTDIEAANSAQMFSISASYGYIPVDDPCSNWPSDLSVDHCNDLLSMLAIKA